MTVIINPGSGPVANATRENADIAIQAFVADIGIEHVRSEFLRAETDGRFMYTLRSKDGACEVEMPGLPLVRVRYTGDANQNIWDFPRLYVDGNSWVWYIGCGIAADILSGREEA